MNIVNKILFGTFLITLTTGVINIYSYMSYMHPLLEAQKETVMFNENLEFNESGVAEQYVEHHTFKRPNPFFDIISTTTRVYPVLNQSVVFRYIIGIHPNQFASSKQMMVPQQIIIPQGSVSDLFPTEAELHFYRNNERNYYQNVYLDLEEKVWCYSMISLNNIVCLRGYL